MKNKGYAKFGWGSWGGGGGGARSVRGDVKMMVNFLRASNH